MISRSLFFKTKLRFFLACLFLAGCFAIHIKAAFAQDDDFSAEVSLVQLSLNGKLNLDSEVLIVQDKVFLPVKQIAALTDVEYSFNRENRLLRFTERSKNAKVEISLTSKSLKVDGSQLEPSLNQIFWVQKSIFLSEETLISQDLIESFFDVKISYDPENLIVNLFTTRPLKALRQNIQFKDDEPEGILKPRPAPKFSLRTLQTTYGIRGQNTQFSSPLSSSSQSFLVNNLYLDAVGDFAGGLYRVGPNFYFTQNDFGLAGVRQSWSKNLSKTLGVKAGDTNLQMSRLNFAGSDVFGLHLGTPQVIGTNLTDTLSFQGVCQSNSEVLLLLNGQQIARQLCKVGKYDFSNIPRLINPNNVYQILQRNTDGTEIVLREDRLSFFNSLVPAKEKKWQVFLGRPSFTNLRQPSFDGTVSKTQIPNKAIAGAQVRYGLTPRLTLEADASLDQLLSSPGFFFPNQLDRFLLTDPRLLSGQTASIGLAARPRDSLGLHWNIALSNSMPTSSAKELLRSGPGFASFFNYDWRYRNLSQTGNFYYFSPNFYAPGGLLGNRMGGNFSLSGNFKKHSLGLNLQQDINNLDRKSFGGKQTFTRLTTVHNWQISPSASLQNSLNINKDSSDANDTTVTVARTYLRQAVNRRLDFTLSSGFINQEIRKPSTFKSFIGDVTTGASLYLDRERLNQLNFGTSFFTNDTRNFYLQGRFNYKNFVYQPSINLFQGQNNTRGYSLSQGLFWQNENGLRLGLEYTYSNSESPFGAFFDSGGIRTRGGKSSTSNHSVALNLFNTIGFFDGKPHLLPSPTIGGMVKGKVFLDLNKDGKQDPNEPGIKGAEVVMRDKHLKVNERGEFSLINIPAARYEVYIDTLSLPFTVTPLNQYAVLETATGKVTEVSLTVALNSATISGKLEVFDLNGKMMEAGNIVIVAVDSQGKEAAYTYTTQSGYYILSELAPGSYTVRLDKAEVVKRNLSFKEPEYNIQIPVDFDNYTEIKNVNFKALQTSF